MDMLSMSKNEIRLLVGSLKSKIINGPKLKFILKKKNWNMKDWILGKHSTLKCKYWNGKLEEFKKIRLEGVF